MKFKRYRTPDGDIFNNYNLALRHASLLAGPNATIGSLRESIRTEVTTSEEELTIEPKRDGWEEQYLPKKDKSKPALPSHETEQLQLIGQWKRTATLLERDIENLRKDYDAGKKEIKQLKASKVALTAIKERLEDIIRKRDRDLHDCIEEIKRLKVLTSKDNVVHTRVLPPLVIKRPYKGG